MGEMVTYPSDGSSCVGFLEVPAEPNGAAVIVIQEWWGLVGHVKDVVRRFADNGFVALAPDLYHGVATGEPDEAARLMMGLAMDRAGQDMAGAAAYLAARPEVAQGGPHVGVVGFCMGGSLALWAGTLSADIGAAAGFYPAVPWERMRPEWSGYAGKSVQIHCSEEDGTSAADGIQLAKRSIEDAGGQVELFDYPGSKHAFFNDDRPEVYHPEASELAWNRVVGFFTSKLT
jgi:carboxymethylenebutenolidase